MILNRRTLIIPDRPGNSILLGLQNVLADPSAAGLVRIGHFCPTGTAIAGLSVPLPCYHQSLLIVVPSQERTGLPGGNPLGGQ